MAAPVRITRGDLDPAGLRRAARSASIVATSRRRLALALVLEGTSRSEAAGMDRQMLRDRVHRTNEEGLAGLSDWHGEFEAKRFLSPRQEACVAGWVRRGPDLAEPGVVRWRRADLAPYIEARLGVMPAERSITTVLRRLGFRRLAVPSNMVLLHLPPYSPELNSVENVRAHLRGNTLRTGSSTPATMSPSPAALPGIGSPHSRSASPRSEPEHGQMSVNEAGRIT